MNDEISSIRRPDLDVKLPPMTEIEHRQITLGELSKHNHEINTAISETTFKKIQGTSRRVV
jgi:hypothetical protein